MILLMMNTLVPQNKARRHTHDTNECSSKCMRVSVCVCVFACECHIFWVSEKCSSCFCIQSPFRLPSSLLARYHPLNVRKFQLVQVAKVIPTMTSSPNDNQDLDFKRCSWTVEQLFHKVHRWLTTTIASQSLFPYISRVLFRCVWIWSAVSPQTILKCSTRSRTIRLINRYIYIYV